MPSVPEQMVQDHLPCRYHLVLLPGPLVFSTVGGSGWSTNLPLNIGPFRICSDGELHDTLVPTNPGCLASYRFCLFVFALIVVPLSCLDCKASYRPSWASHALPSSCPSSCTACYITAYTAHHSFKLHLQPECRTHHQCYVLRSPGLPSQLCLAFQCGGLGPLHPCVHLCPDAPPWHPQPHPPHQAEEGAPLVHGSHLWHHPLLLHDTGNSGVLVVWRETASLNWVRADVRACKKI